MEHTLPGHSGQVEGNIWTQAEECEGGGRLNGREETKR